MRDVLEVLSKLPRSCLVWESGQGYVINRGVAGLHEYPIPSENDVILWNFNQKITPEQVEAMRVGATLGWDAPGADIQFTGGSHTYVYSAPLQVMLSVNANNEEDAAKIAAQSLDKLVEYLQNTVHDHVLTVVRDGIIDMIEENKNAE